MSTPKIAIVPQNIHLHVLPKFQKDTTDRNRTSPFAFTGNKFEFRMLGSSASIASANIVMNTAVAQVLREFAEELDGAVNFQKALHDLIKRTIVEHKRILFNGNGYEDAWIEEAEHRGLSNFRTTPEALVHYMDKKNVELFTQNKVLSESEMRARAEIYFENYCKVLNVEALTMVDMTRRSILPAVSKFAGDTASNAACMMSVLPNADTSYEARICGTTCQQLGYHCRR